MPTFNVGLHPFHQAAMRSGLGSIATVQKNDAHRNIVRLLYKADAAHGECPDYRAKTIAPHHVLACLMPHYGASA